MPAPAPPTPPTYYPPTAESGRGRGPRGQFPRWITAIAVLVAVFAAGFGGWALRGATTPEPTPVATPEPPGAANVLTPGQAKQQACDAFTTIGAQWADSYREWLPVVTTPGWRWTDPVVKEATDKFATKETRVVTQINALVAPTTPPDVRNAITDYTSAILTYAAGHGTASQTQMNAQEAAIDAAAAHANQVCNS